MQVQRNPDPVLHKAAGRTYAWLQSLQAGQVSSVTEIATAENLAGSYITRVLRIAYLAPDIIEAIVAGKEPPELTANRLVRLKNLPVDWAGQREYLGFPTD
jgi:site-specific DNA recombinase